MLEELLTERAQRKVNERRQVDVKSRSVMERWELSPAAPVSGGRRLTVKVRCDAVDVVTVAGRAKGKRKRRR